jgi:D-inositol-3-phosphate glycosyltransferase
VSNGPRLRVLYSFPHTLGAGRIADTAWYQIDGVATAGADVRVFSRAVLRPPRAGVELHETLARGRLRLPVRIVGSLRSFALHDRVVAARLPHLADRIDIVHAWPLGALQTLRVAGLLGIPTVLERPNAHTRYAYEAVQRECDRLGLSLPSDHEHAWNPAVLEREEAEYRAADRLLCPSEFVVKTFRDEGFPSQKLPRHIYGFDKDVFHPAPGRRGGRSGLRMLFVGVCAVRKGVHFALEAWLRSPARHDGEFLIAGEFLPAYEERLSDMLADPSVKVLGHRNDVPELMRESDVVVLPSIEEGFGLVCVEAMGSGAVPLVSDACTDVCRHEENALVHHVGDVDALTDHITRLHEDRAELERLRAGALRTAPEVTWTAAGRVLLDVYRATLAAVPDPAAAIATG